MCIRDRSKDKQADEAIDKMLDDTPVDEAAGTNLDKNDELMDDIKDVEDDCIMEDGTLVPIRVRGRKEILDTYYDYFVNHFGDSKDTFAE